VASAPTARPALVARVILVRKWYPPGRVLEAVEVKKVRDTEGVASLENERALEKIRKDMAEGRECGGRYKLLSRLLACSLTTSSVMGCCGVSSRSWHGTLRLMVRHVPAVVDLALT
jgi:hypothetical protein